MSSRSLLKIVRVKLRLWSYKISRSYFLSNRMKHKRLQKCRRIKRLVAAGRHNRVMTIKINATV
ncbi:unnamed protein product [Meloidogyne enterolobii]|uniref:Uncharacterized protein n=1 Tax=Meloidogyne enterolobii TaxID=390850 RepID=A0ACB1ANN7_MELEN